jgi:TM2 domain-containing membrane protein YozV
MAVALREKSMNANVGQGSTGNVIAAVCSFFIPGLGQLVQGRWLWALFWFVFTGLIWLITFTTGGWIGHLAACLHAAVYQKK